MATAAKTRWEMTGVGYEYCNCDFGCGCNFSGFPNSKDGSCRALVGFTATKGKCGDVDLAGVKGAGIFLWPKAIHEGNGKAAFIVDPATTDKQIDALSKIFTGQLGASFGFMLPVSTPCNCTRLRTSRPAPMSRTNERATCVTTRASRR